MEYLDSLKDLVEKIDNRSTEETSKNSNVNAIKECLERIVVVSFDKSFLIFLKSYSDIDFDELETYLDYDLTDPASLMKFESIFVKLKNLSFESSPELLNIAFVKSLMDKKEEFLKKVQFKLLSTVKTILEKFFNFVKDDNEDLNHLPYSQANNVLSILKPSLSQLFELDPSLISYITKVL